jgi:Tfp pilus assembly protein PilF
MVTTMRHDKTIFICVVLTFAVIIVFRQTLYFDFILYDDVFYVTKNPHLQHGLSKHGLLWALTTLNAGNWHPLTWLSLMFDFELYGLDPGGYHVTSTMIHLLGGIFLFLAFREMTCSVWKSALIAMIFLIHPLHVESVASVAGRKDVLSGLFWALTMLAYVRYTRKPSLRAYILTAFFFVFGLMSKPTVITLPFVMALLDYWPLKRFGWHSQRQMITGSTLLTENSPTHSSNHYFKTAPLTKLLFEKIPFFFLSFCASGLTWTAQKGSAAVIPLSNISLTGRLYHAANSYILYIWKTIWPVDLSFFYPYHPQTSLEQFLLALLFLTGITALSWHLRKSAPSFIIGWLWFILTMLPMIGIIQVGSQAMADRYTYIPMTGLSIIFVYGIGANLPFRNIKGVTSAIWIVILALLIADSRYQTKYWHDSRTLFEHALITTKENYVAHTNLGTFFLKEQKYDSAEFHYREALRIIPQDAEAGNNLGQVLVMKGKHSEAEKIFLKVLENHPDYVYTRRQLCDLFMKTGRKEEALLCYRKALPGNPDNPELHNNFAVALYANGQKEEAILYLQKALRLQPGYREAKRNLDLLLNEQAPLK